MVELLRSAASIERIFVADEIARSPVVGEIRRRARDADVPLRVVPKAEIDRLVGRGHHQGVAALTAEFRYTPLEDLLARPDPAVLVVDGIMDPHNLGSLLRSADGAGFDGVVIRSRRAVQVTSAVRRVASGAAEVVPVARVGNLTQALEQSKEAGLWVVGLDERAERDIWSSELLQRPVAVVVGAEDRGLSRAVRDHCDDLCGIPSTGRLSSLNAAVAGAIALFEVRRREVEGES